MNVMKAILIFILVIVVFLALDYSGLLWSGVILRKRAEIHRDVFEETRSFNEGMAQELARYKYQYNTASSETERTAIASIIRHRFAEYDATEMRDSGLRQFMIEIRGY